MSMTKEDIELPKELETIIVKIINSTIKGQEPKDRYALGRFYELAE